MDLTRLLIIFLLLEPLHKLLGHCPLHEYEMDLTRVLIIFLPLEQCLNFLDTLIWKIKENDIKGSGNVILPRGRRGGL